MTEVSIATRQATSADLEELVADVQQGFDSYVAFAPLGWQPPDMSADRARTSDYLADPATWALLALAGGRCAGHVAFFPAREPTPADNWRERPLIPGLAHLWQLFVRPPWWGQGVAPVLHQAAVAEIGARGFQRARLFTPSLHVRARRFYERRGWSPCREQWSEDLGLMITEYGLSLSPEPPLPV
jgi:GNAT superfamily N-acetyltransferase